MSKSGQNIISAGSVSMDNEMERYGASLILIPLLGDIDEYIRPASSETALETFIFSHSLEKIQDLLKNICEGMRGNSQLKELAVAIINRKESKEEQKTEAAKLLEFAYRAVISITYPGYAKNKQRLAELLPAYYLYFTHEKVNDDNNLMLQSTLVKERPIPQQRAELATAIDKLTLYADLLPSAQAKGVRDLATTLNVSKAVTKGAIKDADVALATEFVYRATTKLIVPEHDKNNSRFPAVLAQLVKNPWGRRAAIAIAAVCATALVGGAIALAIVSSGASIPFTVPLILKLAAGGVGLLGGLIGGVYAAVAQKPKLLPIAEAAIRGLFSPPNQKKQVIKRAAVAPAPQEEKTVVTSMTASL